jgi:hypothetical protein
MPLVVLKDGFAEWKHWQLICPFTYLLRQVLSAIVCSPGWVVAARRTGVWAHSLLSLKLLVGNCIVVGFSQSMEFVGCSFNMPAVLRVLHSKAGGHCS